MDYRRFGDQIVARFDRGEEILASLKKLALLEGIRLASVSALGAVDDFTVGVYKVDEQKYYANHFSGAFEIVSLTGTISTMDGEYYAHLHMSAGDDAGRVFGGHLNSARISATCELVITVINGTVERKKDPAVGLNLFEFV